MEGAVGYSTRSKRKGKGKGKEQWWERKEATFVEERETEAGIKVQEMVRDAILDKVEQVTGEEKRRVVNRNKKSQDGRMEWKEEVSTLIIELNVDELLRADGAVKVDVPLHLRYQTPKGSLTTRRLQTGTVASHSPYATLLRDILPLHSFKNAKQAVFGFFSNTTSLTFPHPAASAAESGWVESQIIPSPTIFLTCPPPSSPASNGGATKYVEGFYSTPLSTLFPPTHSHLLPLSPSIHGQSEETVHALSQTKTKQPAGGLKVKVPVPDVTLLAPVQIITLVTVVGAALRVLYYLLVSVVGRLEEVEKGL